MTIYIQNTTDSDFKYSKNGYEFTLYGDRISRVDESLITFQELFDSFGHRVYLINNPTVEQIASSINSLSLDNSNLSAEAISLLNQLARGGDRIKRQLEYLFEVQKLIDAIKKTTGPATGAFEATSGQNIPNFTNYKGFIVTTGGTMTVTYADDSTINLGTISASPTVYLHQIKSFTGTANISVVK